MKLNDIRNWQIYLCPNCNASNPPKDKFVVILYKDRDSAWGFFINSAIHPFIQRNEELLVAQVEIAPPTYPFLKHTSYIGCHELKQFYGWDLRRKLSSIEPATKQTILDVVKQSTTLSEAQKDQILNS
jgi:hypothetical protein